MTIKKIMGLIKGGVWKGRHRARPEGVEKVWEWECKVESRWVIGAEVLFLISRDKFFL